MNKHSNNAHSNPLSGITALAALLLLLSAPSVQAETIIDFGAATLGVPATPYSEDGFTLTQTTAADGIFAGGAPFNNNGTQLFEWCGACSGVLSLSSDAGDIFSATSIEFGALTSPSATPTLVAVGYLAAGETVTTAFTAVAGTLSTFFFGAGFADLTSLDLFLSAEFEPGGATDSGIDNIVLAAASTVPEPTSMLLFGTGLLGLALRRRRRN